MTVTVESIAIFTYKEIVKQILSMAIKEGYTDKDNQEFETAVWNYFADYKLSYPIPYLAIIDMWYEYRNKSLIHFNKYDWNQ